MVKVIKILMIVPISTILVLFLGGNYFVAYAEENSLEGTPRVIAQAKTDIKELPKTGLPLVGFGLASLFPAGLLLKKVIKRSGTRENSPNAIWTGRQLRD